MKNADKHVTLNKIVTAVLFITLLLSVIFTIIKIIVAPSAADPNAMNTVRVKSDYTLMLVQCVLGLVVMMLPGMIEKKLRVSIPSMMNIMFVVFLYCAIYLGEVRDFYFKIPHWDVILHCFSGGMLGALGFSVISLLNKSDRISMDLSPAFVAFFTFCFAMMLGAVWEIYEFTMDGVLSLNMQKFALEDGTLLLGRAALVYTMKDLIVDAVGAIVISVIGYISLKYKKGWLESFLIRKKKDTQQK